MRRRRVKQIQECQFLFCWKERRFEGITSQFPQMLVGKVERLLSQLIFARQGGTKHRRVVSVKSDHHSLVEILPHRMSTQGGACTGAKIAGEAYLQGDLPDRELLHQLGILRRRQPMPDTFRS